MLNDVNGSIIFQQGDTITGSGKITNKNILKIHSNLLLPDSIIFNQISGAISSDGSLNIADSMNESSGDIMLPLTILSGAVLNINTTSSKSFLDIINNGTINWNAGDINFNSKATFTNNNQFNIYDVGSLLYVESATKLTNTFTGKIEKFTSQKTTNVSADITNLGSILIHSGSLVINGNFHNNYLFKLEAGTYVLNIGTFTADSSSILRGSGQFESDGTNIINFNDTLPANLDVIFEGILKGTGKLYAPSTLSLYGTCSIPVTIMNTGECYLSSHSLLSFTNNGFTKVASSINVSSGFLNNDRLEIIGSNAYCYFTKSSSTARFINNGKLIGDDFHSSFLINFPFVNTSTGSLEGAIAFYFEDSLINDGSINPSFKNPGQIQFYYSPLQSSSVMNIRIGKNGKGETKADNVSVFNGKCKIAGTLNLYQTSDSIKTGYYTILQGNTLLVDSIVGRFSKINKPDNWDVIYKTNSIGIRVKAVVDSLKSVALSKNVNSFQDNSTAEVKYLIFPNPAQAAITIQFKSIKEEQYIIELFDIHGRQLQYKRDISILGINNIDLEVSKYLPGTYIVKISKNGQQKTLKFIKE